jgi:hypothetical protein
MGSSVERNRREVAVEAGTGWLFVRPALVAAGAEPHLAEPAETHKLRGRERRRGTIVRVAGVVVAAALALPAGAAATPFICTTPSSSTPMASCVSMT